MVTLATSHELRAKIIPSSPPRAARRSTARTPSRTSRPIRRRRSASRLSYGQFCRNCQAVVPHAASVGVIALQYTPAAPHAVEPLTPEACEMHLYNLPL